MSTTNVQFFSYRLPLLHTLLLRQHRIASRSGILVKVTGEDGSTGWGDAAPLPGMSLESLDVLGDYFGDVMQLVNGGDPASAALPPSLAFAVEQATIQRAGGWPNSGTPIPVNALIAGEGEDIVKSAREAKANGFRAVKVKVGRGSVDDDIRKVQAVAAELGSEIRLRLDANRAWSLPDATRFGKAVGSLVEYVEEPLAHPLELRALHEATAMPLALDETVHDTPVGIWSVYPGIRAIVIKPTLIGSISRIRALAARAADNGATCVISSLFESGVGLHGLAHLAAELSPGVPCGLDTYRWLEKDVLDPRWETGGATLDLSRWTWRDELINHSMLREVRNDGDSMPAS